MLSLYLTFTHNKIQQKTMLRPYKHDQVGFYWIKRINQKNTPNWMTYFARKPLGFTIPWQLYSPTHNTSRSLPDRKGFRPDYNWLTLRAVPWAEQILCIRITTHILNHLITLNECSISTAFEMNHLTTRNNCNNKPAGGLQKRPLPAGIKLTIVNNIPHKQTTKIKHHIRNMRLS